MGKRSAFTKHGNKMQTREVITYPVITCVNVRVTYPTTVKCSPSTLRKSPGFLSEDKRQTVLISKHVYKHLSNNDHVRKGEQSQKSKPTTLV